MSGKPVGMPAGSSLDFSNPPRIIFGSGRFLASLPNVLKNYAAKEVLVVMDEFLSKTDLLPKVGETLKGSGVAWNVHVIPPREPAMDMAEEAAAVVRRSKASLLIGVGGGSTMDMTKLMSIMKTNSGGPLEYAALPPDPLSDKVTKAGLPKVLVPTTAGTGSETSNTLVFSFEGHKTWITSSKVLADIALVDPELTYSMPPTVTRNTGMDALSHLVEGVISSQANPISDGMIYEGVRLIKEFLPIAYRNPRDEEARANVSLAAMLGGWVIGYPWVAGPATIGHCISEGLSPIFNLTHGAANTIILPHALDFNSYLMYPRMRGLASALGIDARGLGDAEAAYAVVKAVVELAKTLEMPYELKNATDKGKDEFTSYIDYILNERQYYYDLPSYNPRKLTRENLEELFEDIWEGTFSTLEGKIA